MHKTPKKSKLGEKKLRNVQKGKRYEKPRKVFNNGKNKGRDQTLIKNGSKFFFVLILPSF